MDGEKWFKDQTEPKTKSKEAIILKDSAIQINRKIKNNRPDIVCPVGLSCRIHRLHLCGGVRPPPNECPGYDTNNLMVRF